MTYYDGYVWDVTFDDNVILCNHDVMLIVVIQLMLFLNDDVIKLLITIDTDSLLWLRVFEWMQGLLRRKCGWGREG